MAAWEVVLKKVTTEAGTRKEIKEGVLVDVPATIERKEYTVIYAHPDLPPTKVLEAALAKAAADGLTFRGMTLKSSANMPLVVGS